ARAEMGSSPRRARTQSASGPPTVAQPQGDTQPGKSMSRPILFADHNFNDHIVSGLKNYEPAIDLLRAREAGMEQALDEDVLAFANDQGRIVLSHDFDTMIGKAAVRISAGQRVAGLYMARQTAVVASVIEDLLLLWACSEAEEWYNLVAYHPV